MTPNEMLLLDMISHLINYTSFKAYATIHEYKYLEKEKFEINKLKTKTAILKQTIYKLI